QETGAPFLERADGVFAGEEIAGQAGEVVEVEATGARLLGAVAPLGLSGEQRKLPGEAAGSHLGIRFEEPLALIANAPAQIADSGNDPWQSPESLDRARGRRQISGCGREEGSDAGAKALQGGSRQADRLRAAICEAARQPLFQRQDRLEQVGARRGEGCRRDSLLERRCGLDHLAGRAAALRERGEKRLELVGEAPSESAAGKAEVLAQVASRLLQRSFAVEGVEDGGERRLRSQLLALHLVEH